MDDNNKKEKGAVNYATGDGTINDDSLSNDVLRDGNVIGLDRFKRQLDFLIEIDKLKQVYRRTILMDASRLENDAEHMWHMAIGTMLFEEYVNNTGIDMLKVLKMVILHDIVEIYAGDTFAYDEQGHIDKEEKEQNAANKIFGLLPKDQEVEFRNFWNEFEMSNTLEAKYAKALDRFMPILHNYITEGIQWHKFGVTKDKVLAKNCTIEQGSSFLWKYIKYIVDDSVDKGYLPTH